MTLMRYFKLFLSIMIVLTLGLYLCCGGGSDPNPEVTVTLSITDGSTSVARNASVTAVFSGAITEPSSWTDAFTLKNDNAGSSLCSSITYDSTTFTATCSHDNLEFSSSYTMAASGIKAADSSDVVAASATFTTAAMPNISSFTKTSAGPGAAVTITATFIFDTSVDDDITPDVQISSTAMADLSIGTCGFTDTERTTYACPVNNMKGCDQGDTTPPYIIRPADYTLELSIDSTQLFSRSFNNQDDEFDNEETLAHCWMPDYPAGVNASLDGLGNVVFTFTLPNVSGDLTGYYNSTRTQALIAFGDMATSFYLSENDYIAPSDSTFLDAHTAFGNSSLDGLDILNGSFWEAGSRYNIWFSSTMDFANVATSTDSILAGWKAPFYTCFVASGGTIKTFISTDGISYSQLTSGNMQCSGACYISTITEYPTSGWQTISNLELGASVGSDLTYAPKFGYVRYRTSNITGASADCPELQ